MLERKQNLVTVLRENANWQAERPELQVIIRQQKQAPGISGAPALIFVGCSCLGLVSHFQYWIDRSFL